MKGFFVVFITVVIMAWLATRAAKTKAHQVNGDWVFPVIKPVQWLFVLVLALGLALAFFGIRGSQADRTVSVIGGSLFIFFAAFAWPKAIYVSPTGVRQHTWFGGWRNIVWSQVLEVVEKRDRSVVVRGPAGKIVYSPYHADPERFRAEISPHHEVTPRRV